MDEFLFFNDDALSILKQHLTQTDHENDAVGDTVFCISKVTILRSIRDRTENRSVTDEILDSLILIDNLDRRRGIPPSDAMRKAFCAVAVHITLQCLTLSWPRYFDAVQRIWGLKIKDLEESGSSSGLVSPGLDRWRKVIEDSLWDKVISQRLSSINTLDEALRGIRVYLEEAFCSMKYALRRLASESDATARTEADRVASASDPTEGNEILRANSQTRHKLHPSCRQHTGVVIADLEEDGISCGKNGTQYTSELEENRLLQVPLKASTPPLLEEVNDSLSEAVDEVETVSSDMATKTLHAKAIEEDSEKDRGGPTNHFAEPSQAKEGSEASVRPEKVHRISIMERNDTAHTFEWVDSIDGSAEGTNETKHVLKKSEPLNCVRRKVRWTEEEENALMEGVREYGSHWKLILESYREILSKRTPVDLKDKWRNMIGR